MQNLRCNGCRCRTGNNTANIAYNIVAKGRNAICLAKQANCEIKGKIQDISLIAYVCSPADNGVTFGKVLLDNLGVNSSEVLVSYLPKLYEKLLSKLTDGQRRLYEEIELPLASVLCDMEHYGFEVDIDELERFGKRLEQTIKHEKSSRSWRVRVGYAYLLRYLPRRVCSGVL